MKNNINNFIASLEQVSDPFFNWFNVDKCHVLFSKNKPVGIKIGDYTIDNSGCEKLLDLKIDVNLNFNNNISELCKEANRKIFTLARVTPFMKSNKRKLLMNAFFTSQCNYCPLIWMCHSRSDNRKKKLHKSCLRIIYNDKQWSFTELLNKNNSVSIHIKNIQRLPIEMFRFYNGLSPPFMNIIFKLRAENTCNVRQA